MRSGQSESDESAGLLNLQGGYNCQCMPSRVVAEPSHGETPEKDQDQKAGHRPGYYTNIHLLRRQHSTVLDPYMENVCLTRPKRSERYTACKTAIVNSWCLILFFLGRGSHSSPETPVSWLKRELHVLCLLQIFGQAVMVCVE